MKHEDTHVSNNWTTMLCTASQHCLTPAAAAAAADHEWSNTGAASTADSSAMTHAVTH